MARCVLPVRHLTRWRDIDLARVAAWLIPFLVVVYLGMRRGGYEEQIRGPIGVLAWILVAGGLLSITLPRARISRSAWIGLGLLAAFGVWTAIGISWSESSGRSLTEAARVATYVGAFTVAIMIGGRERLRTTAAAIGAACAVIAAVALLSRLHPSWFPTDDIADSIVGVAGRLRYPLGYWNALAGLIAFGIPLVAWAATSARSFVLRGAAAAALPSMALALYFTYSRAGAITAVVGIAVFVALSRRRLSLGGPIAVMVAVCAIVVWLGSRRDALASALNDSAAQSQGDQMLAIVVVASLVLGGLVWLLSTLEARGKLPKAPEVPRRTAAIALGATVLVLLVGFVAAGGIGTASDKFDRFKEPTALSTDSARLTSASGNGRWQYWTSAVDAYESAKIEGIGPGTYRFWWTAHRLAPQNIRDAHSLFVEVLGELGIVGLLLIASFFAMVLLSGARRALAAAGERRGELAALTAAATVFTLGAAVDWLWELAVLPVAFLFVAAAILSTREDDEDREDRDRVDASTEIAATAPHVPRAAGGRELLLRFGGAVAALALAVGIYIPASAAQDLADSRNDFDDGDLSGALVEATEAADALPFAAEPREQQAKVLEENEEFARAAAAARAATEREPTNWETFYLLSRIQAQRGDSKRGPALVALRRAQDLNPLETLVNPVNCEKPTNPCGLTPPPG